MNTNVSLDKADIDLKTILRLVKLYSEDKNPNKTIDVIIPAYKKIGFGESVHDLEKDEYYEVNYENRIFKIFSDFPNKEMELNKKYLKDFISIESKNSNHRHSIMVWYYCYDGRMNLHKDKKKVKGEI